MPKRKSRFMLIKDDVSVENIPVRTCTDCDERLETHQVVVDLRAVGEKSAVYRGCKSCANKYAMRLQDSLPQNESPGEPHAPSKPARKPRYKDAKKPPRLVCDECGAEGPPASTTQNRITGFWICPDCLTKKPATTPTTDA